jgi:hypothetical protein
MENYITELIIAIGGGVAGIIFLVNKMNTFRSSEHLTSTANESYTKLYTNLVQEIDRLREAIEELKTEYKRDISELEDKQTILVDEINGLKTKNESLRNMAISVYNFIMINENKIDNATVIELKDKLMKMIVEEVV